MLCRAQLLAFTRSGCSSGLTPQHFHPWPARRQRAAAGGCLAEREVWSIFLQVGSSALPPAKPSS